MDLGEMTTSLTAGDGMPLSPGSGGGGGSGGIMSSNLEAGAGETDFVTDTDAITTTLPSIPKRSTYRVTLPPNEVLPARE